MDGVAMTTAECDGWTTDAGATAQPFWTVIKFLLMTLWHYGTKSDPDVVWKQTGAACEICNVILIKSSK